MPQLTDSVKVLRGVGPSRLKQLEGLGIRTLYDLLCYFPRRYEDRTKITAIADLQPDEPACIEAIVASAPRTAHIRRGMDITRLTVADHSARLNISFFNQSYVTGSLHYGETYYFYGSISSDSPTRQFTNPVFEAEASAPISTRRIVPVYPLTAGLSGKVLSKLIADALDACLQDIPEILPTHLRSAYNLCSVQEAYRNIHQPQDMPSLELARKRLIFEEFFIFAAGLQLLRASRTAKACCPFEQLDLSPFLSALPFAPTGAQRRAMEDLMRDFASGVPMNRLL